MVIRKRVKRHTIGRINSVNNWTNALTGTPCFILGNGPSLNRQNIKLLSSYFTIGINRIFYKLDPTILIFQDMQLWHSDKHNVLKTHALKYCRDKADIQGRFYHFKLMTGEYSLPENPSVLKGRGSTGPLAFQLAYLLGCDPIILVAMDCCYEEGKTDFYGVNPMHKHHTLRNCVKGLEWIRDCKCGRKVVNCSDNKVFDKCCTIEETITQIYDIAPINREVVVKKIFRHNQ
tara:strand:+ start:1646 stop:2341 length:696 start_codon:yes stop_codon:yes gene_type:complete